MKRLAGYVASLLLACSLCFGVAGTASAAVCNTASNPLQCACSAGGGASSSPACNPGKGDPIAGPNGILKKASLVIAFIGGVTAVIIILLGGFMFVTANGDAQKVANARRAVLGAVIGIIIIAASESIIIFVVNKL